FIVSHLSSGWKGLVDSMNRNPLVEIRNTNKSYEHPTDVISFNSSRHIKVCGDALLFDHLFSCKSLYKKCKFVYLVRSAKDTLNSIIANQNGDILSEYVLNYYVFRLRRICEMAHFTNGACLLTYDNLISGNGADVLRS